MYITNTSFLFVIKSVLIQHRRVHRHVSIVDANDPCQHTIQYEFHANSQLKNNSKKIVKFKKFLSPNNNTNYTANHKQ